MTDVSPATAPTRLTARALIVGERIDTAGLERPDMISSLPLAFRVGEPGMAALFRFGVAVMVGLSPLEEEDLLAKLRSRVTGARALGDDEIAVLEIAPDGEILLRGPNIMKGYYKLEAETKEAIDENGWLHTGDIGKIDVEGYISITDRKKEIIVLSGGKNVSPAYVEGKLVGDKFISQACVIGDRRKHLAALIVPDYENLVDFLKENNLDVKNSEALAKSRELKAFIQTRIREINKQLSDVEAVASFTIVPQPFAQENGELTPSLKIRRKIVQAHFQQQIDSMYGD